jgi:deazaflavin-dependent oxidoreductase (nitroreductase family)
MTASHDDANAWRKNVPDGDINALNRQVIDNYRGGETTRDGIPLVLLTITGRKSGERRVTPLAVQEDGDRLLVVGSMGGASRNPQWYENLKANPDVEVEYKGRQFRARATTVPHGPERDRLFALMSEALPPLPSYQAKAEGKRQIPVVVIEPAD